MMKKFLFAILTLALVLCLLPAISQQTNATEVTELTVIKKDVKITCNKPAIGMAISDLTATVFKANLEGIYVYNGFTGEEVTEGCFENGIVYYIHYVLTPREGEKFAEDVGTTSTNGGYRLLKAESETRLVYKNTFTTCVSTLSVSIHSPVLTPGMKPEDISISLPSNANCTVTSLKVIDLQDNSEAEEILQNGQYRLQLSIVPKKGYVLYETFSVYFNNVEMDSVCKNAGSYCESYLDFSLDVGEIEVTWTSFKFRPGQSPTTPRITLSNARVTDGNTRWLDAQKNKLTGGAVGGQMHYMAFDIAAIGPVGPWEMPVVTAGQHEVTVEVIDATHATVYVHFPCPYDMGKIQIFPQGIAEGKSIKDITSNLLGNAKLGGIRVQDEDRKTIEDGVFDAGHIYTLTFYIYPLKNYSIGRETTVEVNGEEYSWSDHTTYLTLTMKLDTRTEIKTAKVSLSGMGIGKTISKVKISPASGSKFDVYDRSWASTDTSSTKFKKGELYQVCVTIEADEGYRFTENTVFSIGGKEAFDVSTGSSNERLYGTVEFSYLTEVTKVSLPAMPKSITPGTTLPTNFKVSSSAKYTLTPIWMSMNTMETVTMANKNGCYILTYAVTAKDGYEFTEDTVFYVDGKKVTPVVMSAYYAQIMKPYNVGLTVVDRIDLTLPEPEHGAVPGEVTVPADAAYAIAGAAWGVNTTGKLKDGGDTVTTFQNYKYHFLAVEMQTNPGYIFADKVAVYINGDKYTTLEDINLGVAYQTAVCFGKLGEIAKLTAPELSKDGLTLSWHGVPNADGYEVYRATSKSGKYSKVATVSETTWQDAAAAGNTYYYKVKAIFTPDTTKNSGYSNYVSIVYTCDAPEITVENGSTGKPVLSWEKISGAKKYTVYRATSETGKYTKLGTTTKLTYTDSKAKAGSTYFYKVIAGGSKSTYNSGYSNIVSCNVICGTPAVTLKLDAATGKPSLSWKKIDAAAGYRILRQLPGEEDFTVIAEQIAVTFLDTSAPIDTLCKYKVQTLGNSEALHGNFTKVLEIASGIARPSLQTGLDAKGKPQLTWAPIEGAVTYEIYRSTKSTKSYTLLATVETPGYTDETVSPGKTYYYKVVAVGNVGKSAETGYVKLSGKCANPQITAEVEHFSGKPVITWEKIAGAKKYTVYRATAETGKYTKLGTTTKLTYTDSKATVGKTYYYKIVANASKSSYNSGYSNLVSCTPTCAVPVIKVATAAATGKPVLTWKKITGAVRYEIWLEQAGAKELLTSTTKLTFTDESIAPGETKIYWVYAVDALGEMAGEWVVATATCPQPKLKGKVGETGKPELTWEAVDGATKYIVYRSTKKSSGYKAIDETESLTFTDTTTKKGKTYYYKLVAVCEDTQSAQSSYVKVKSK